MSYNNKINNKNEAGSKRINLDEIVEDEFNLSKKKQPIVDSKTETSDEKQKHKVNLNEDAG